MLQLLTILHLALTGGATIFVLVAYFVHHQGMEVDESMATILVPLSLAMAAGGVLAGQMMYKQGLARISADQPMEKRLEAYKGVFILRLALIEGPALFGAVVHMITGSIWGLGISICLIAWMVMLRPTADGVAMDLGLSPGERKAFLEEE